MSNFFELIGARPTALATSAANLRTEPSAKFVPGQPVVVQIAGASLQFTWNAASLAVDNGTTVIKPNDILAANPGRFLIIPVTVDIPPARQTLYVDGGYTGAITDGGIATPYKTISTAIAAVPAPTLDNEVWTILIAGGRYSETPIIPADRWIILQAITDSSLFNDSVILGPVGGPFFDIEWHMGLVANRNGCGIKGIVCKSILIFATALGGTTLSVEDTFTVPGGIVVIAGIWTGSLVLNRSAIGSGLTMPDATLLGSENLAIGAASVLVAIDSDSRFIGAVTINQVAALGMSTFKGSFVTGPLSCPASNYSMDPAAMRFASKAGAFTTTPTGGSVDLFRGDANFYEMTHLVRVIAAVGPTVLNYADDYVSCAPPIATTEFVTLPNGMMFADFISGTDTAGGVLRLKARQLYIKNVGAGNVYIAPFVGDFIDTAGAALPLVLLAGESARLVPLFVGGAYRWQVDYRFGQQYMTATSVGASGSVAAAFAVKLPLTTEAVSGLYMVRWSAVLSNSVGATDCEAQLFDATAAVQLGGTVYADTAAASTRVYAGGVALVTFVGLGKVLQVRWRRAAGAGTATIDNATIEVWRVG